MEKDFKDISILLEEALKEFSENRYDTASLNNILKNANISKGSFYYHFSNKKDLYIYLLKSIVDIKMNFFSKYIKDNNISIEKYNLFEVLRVTTTAGFNFAKEYSQYNKLGLRIIREDSKEVKKELEEFTKKSYEDFLVPLIHSSIENKELREDFSIDFLTKLVINIFTHFSNVLFEDDIIDYDKAFMEMEAFIDFIENGLKRR